MHMSIRASIISALALLAVPVYSSVSAATVTPHSVGFIGCSNTKMSVEGYTTISNTNQAFWPVYDTGGGSVDKWADPTSTYWKEFKQMYATYKTSTRVVWINLCEDYLITPATYTEVQTMFAILRQVAPGLKYYVSPINMYSPITLCSMMGRDGQGITDTDTWATEAVKDGLALAGPSMGPLTASTTLNDGCHPNSAGEALLGQQLASFFGQ